MNESSNESTENAEELTERAFEALNSGDLESAETLATQLRGLSYSSYFEIQALVHLDREESDSALEVLREGVKEAPFVWRLWQLLGNTLSDANDFDGAMRCYEEALRLDLDAEDNASVQFNRATLLSRIGRSTEALEVLNELDATISQATPGLGWRVETLRLRVLADLGRREDVLAHAELLQQWFLEAEQDDADSLSVVWAQGGQALLDCGENEKAREWARHALEWERTNGDALQLLRLSHPTAPRGSRYFEVMLEGDWVEIGEEDQEAIGFIKTFMVVARVAEEAEKLALEMEAAHTETSSVRVTECQSSGECDETAVGVYEASCYHLFPRSGQDEDEANSDNE